MERIQYNSLIEMVLFFRQGFGAVEFKWMDFKDWQSATDEVIRELPYHVAEWVAEFGSLTQKLSHYVDEVRLDLLREDAERPSPTESKALELDEKGLAQIREVVLYGPSQPWIFARTLVATTNGNLILELGTKPLGSILFSSKELRRESLEVRQIDSNHRLFEQAKVSVSCNLDDSTLWARRSLWASADDSKKLLLLEVFLPDSPLYHQYS